MRDKADRDERIEKEENKVNGRLYRIKELIRQSLIGFSASLSTGLNARVLFGHRLSVGAGLPGHLFRPLL
jgi:hypothetical protein